MIENNSGREWGIRTPGGVNLAGFKTGTFDQLCQLSTVILVVRMVRIELTLRNRNGILSPTRLPIPPHSH